MTYRPPLPAASSTADSMLRNMTPPRGGALLILIALAGCGTSAALPTALVTEASPGGQSGGDAPVVARRHVVRKTVVHEYSDAIPPVLLTAAHRKLCAIGVGDKFPRVSLPRVDGGTTELTTLYGRQATVILFWHPDRWMARTALVDLQRDIAAKFEAQQVAVVGIGVEQTGDAIRRWVGQADVKFPQLVDATGRALAEVGSAYLPRLYVLDHVGKIVWFDIEYSEGTRRELGQTLAVLTAAD